MIKSMIHKNLDFRCHKKTARLNFFFKSLNPQLSMIKPMIHENFKWLKNYKIKLFL